MRAMRVMKGYICAFEPTPELELEPEPEPEPIGAI
jgi:hypothetical protein